MLKKRGVKLELKQQWRPEKSFWGGPNNGGSLNQHGGSRCFGIRGPSKSVEGEAHLGHDGPVH